MSRYHRWLQLCWCWVSKGCRTKFSPSMKRIILYWVAGGSGAEDPSALHPKSAVASFLACCSNLLSFTNSFISCIRILLTLQNLSTAINVIFQDVLPVIYKKYVLLNYHCPLMQQKRKSNTLGRLANYKRYHIFVCNFSFVVISNQHFNTYFLEVCKHPHNPLRKWILLITPFYPHEKVIQKSDKENPTFDIHLCLFPIVIQAEPTWITTTNTCYIK